jgi:hypothetical protein
MLRQTQQEMELLPTLGQELLQQSYSNEDLHLLQEMELAQEQH